EAASLHDNCYKSLVFNSLDLLKTGGNPITGLNLDKDYRPFSALRLSTFCSKRKLRIIVLWKDLRTQSATVNDAVSSKIAWPKLASITDHAGSRCFWRRGNL